MSTQNARPGRTPGKALHSHHSHKLVAAEKAIPPYPGYYECECGETFTSIFKYETHRAASIRLEKSCDNQSTSLNGSRR